MTADACQPSSQNPLFFYNPAGTGITQIDQNQNHSVHPVLGSHSFVTAIPTCSINDTSIYSSARAQERMTRGAISFPGYSGVVTLIKVSVLLEIQPKVDFGLLQPQDLLLLNCHLPLRRLAHRLLLPL